MDDAALSVFVPYYPMLTTDTYAGYQLSTAAADFVEAQPESGVYYATTKNKRNENGERVKVEGFCVLPENWADSVYWTMDALSNLYEYGTLTDVALPSSCGLCARCRKTDSVVEALQGPGAGWHRQGDRHADQPQQKVAVPACTG